MRWFVGLMGVAAGALADAGPASASSDWWNCEVHWRVESTWRQCGSTALLQPGSDSRLNLFWLIADRRKVLPPGFAFPRPAEENRALGQVFTMWSDVRAQFLPVSEVGYEPRYADFPGSCERLAVVRDEFAAALAANAALSEVERMLLKQARLELETGCHAPRQPFAYGPLPDLSKPPNWPNGMVSASGQAFLGYLKASHAFAREEWSSARQQFAALHNAADPWVMETSKYMAIRIELDSAYNLVADQYGYVNTPQLDPSATERGAQAITAYQSTFPRGRYFAAAENAKRRVLAMRGDWGGLAKVLSDLTESGPRDGIAVTRLIDEIDMFLMSKDRKPAGFLSDPLLLAAWDLKAMRIEPQHLDNDQIYYLADQPYDSDQWPLLTRKDLEAQAPVFAGHDALYAFLDATFAFYHEKDYKRVLTLIPPAAGVQRYSALELSSQALRAMALGKLGNGSAEVRQWTALLGGHLAPYQREAIELGLAISLERSGRLGEVFAPRSPVTDTTVRSQVLQFSASRTMLRTAARDRTRPRRERDTASFTLLYKDLSRGNYADFAADRTLVRPGAPAETWFYKLAVREDVPAGLFVHGPFERGGFACPDLGVTARQLAARPNNSHALLCLGEFWRIGGFDVFPKENIQPSADDLGAIRPQFPGSLLERGDIYLKVLANPSTTRADRAYALYRAVWCYASTGYNTCGGKQVDQVQRKAWFIELKTRHVDSPWARKLEYYW